MPLKRLRLLDRHVRSLDQAPGVHVRLLGIGGASGGAHDEQGERHHPAAAAEAGSAARTDPLALKDCVGVVARHVVKLGTSILLRK